MTDNIKNAFGSIYAEKKLKAETAEYIHNVLQKRGNMRVRSLYRGFAAFAVTAAVIVFSGALSYSLYFTASAYVDFDVNPSLEMTLNRFDRVIKVYPYNYGAEEILSELSLYNKKYNDAIDDLINAASQSGLLQYDGLISITVQTKNIDREDELLSNIQNEVNAAIIRHHTSAQIDVYPVNSDTRTYALEQNISPAKYLAIKELMDLDPATTFEHCKDHSISEIKQFAKEYSGHRHGNNGNSGNNSNNINNRSIDEGVGDNIDSGNNLLNGASEESGLFYNEKEHGKKEQRRARNGNSHHNGGHE